MATTYSNNDGLTLYDILLGQYVSEQINAIQDNFKTLSTNSEDINDRIEQVKNEAHKSTTFDDISELVDTVNAFNTDSDKNKYHIGDNFFIKDLGVPDFWVSGIAETYVAGTAETFSANQYHNVQVGWFILDKLETQHVDLSNTVTTDTTLTNNEILLGNGDKKAKNSGKTIVVGVNNSTWGSATDSTVPTTLAIENRLAKLKEYTDSLYAGLLTDIQSGLYVVGKAKSDQNGNVINEIYATKTDLDKISQSAGKIDTVKVNDNALTITNKTVNIQFASGDENTTKVETDVTTGKTTITALGKVQDVKVNGTSVVSGGVAAITVADLAVGFVSISTSDSSWTTQSINGTTYQAIRVQKTDTALGVFNSSNQEIVIQKTYDANYLYLCVGTTKIPCTIRKLSGGAVGSGGGGSSSTVNAVTQISFNNKIITPDVNGLADLGSINSGIVLAKTQYVAINANSYEGYLYFELQSLVGFNFGGIAPNGEEDGDVVYPTFNFIPFYFPEDYFSHNNTLYIRAPHGASEYVIEGTLFTNDSGTKGIKMRCYNGQPSNVVSTGILTFYTLR